MKKDKAVTRRWFDCWSNEYDRTLGRISFHRGLLDLVVRNAGVKDGDRVLDIGCGTGLLSLKLLQRRECFVTGIDYSREMAAIFEGKIRALGLQQKASVLIMDADGLRFAKSSFDVVVSSVALHHLKDKVPVLKAVARILKPGGTFVIGEIDMDTTGSHRDPERLRRILRVLEQEWIPALKDAGVETFVKMFDNGKKHILNEGEYCVSLQQWAALCRKAGFRIIAVKRVPRYEAFGIVVARVP